MDTKIIKNIQNALEGKKLVRLAHTLDEGIDQTILDISQEIWYKYPTMGEDFLKHSLEAKGIKCVRPFPNSHRDRSYTYDHLVWKMMADGYIDKMEDEPIFFCYKNSTNLDEVSQEYGFRLFMPDYKLFKEFQNKSKLENFGVEKGLGLVPFIESPLKDVTYEKVQKELGEKFVVQFSFGIGGWNTGGSRDTFIIKHKKDFKALPKAYQDTPAKISKFIDGIPLGILVINTEKGPLVNEPYGQVLGDPTLTDHELLFCGINYDEIPGLTDQSYQKIKQIARNVGEALSRKNYKGHFGIDLMMEKDTGDIFVIEINPRFTAGTFMQNFLAHRADKLPPLALHFAEYLECVPDSFDIAAYEKKMQGIMQGSMFYLRNQEQKTIQVESAPKAGLYKITSSGIQFVKEMADFTHLPEKDHFLVSHIYTLKRDLGPIEMLCKICTLENAVENHNALNKKYQKVAKDLYAKFKFINAGAYDSSVPYQVI